VPYPFVVDLPRPILVLLHLFGKDIIVDYGIEFHELLAPLNLQLGCESIDLAFLLDYLSVPFY